MPDQNQENYGTQLAGIMVILVALGTILLQKLPLESARPVVRQASKPTTYTVEDVPARLWQDPLEVVRRYRRSRSTPALFLDTDGTRIRIGSTPDVSQDHSPAEIFGKDALLKAGTHLDLLVVVLPGGPYFEESEWRRRMRYAVVSALGTSHYYSRDAQHIGFFAEQTDGSPPFVVPFEAFQHEDLPGADEPAKAVLALWVEEEKLLPKPLGALEGLLEPLREVLKSPPEKTFILGPYGSTTLKAIVDEIDSPERKICEVLKASPSSALLFPLNPQDTVILSPTATAANDLIGMDGGLEELENVTILRTIATDRSLAERLIEELCLRGLDLPGMPRTARTEEDPPLFDLRHDRPYDHHIVLISELDTFYGRALPHTFENVLLEKAYGQCREGARRGPADTSWIHRFNYLRGLDGQTIEPAGTGGSAEGGAQAQPSSLFQGGPFPDTDGNNPDAVGRAQTDYLHRLAITIQQLDATLRRNSAGEVKAVGILGSDVYDKLLVLRALRSKLPNAIFFTTDLTQVLLQSSEFPSARNVVVASSFGLELAPELQGSIPSFRDSYQTSMYFSTWLALNCRGIGNLKEHWPAIRTWVNKPRIFEIGRGGAIDLPVETTPGSHREEKVAEVLCGEADSLQCIHRIHPHPAAIIPSYWILVVALYLLLLLSILLTHVQPSKPRTRGWSGRPHVYVFVFGALVFIAIFVVSDATSVRLFEEPFSLTGGVSMWPTEIVRVVAILMSIYFLARGRQDVERALDQVEDSFGLVRLRAVKQKRSRYRYGVYIFSGLGVGWMILAMARYNRHCDIALSIIVWLAIGLGWWICAVKWGFLRIDRWTGHEAYGAGGDGHARALVSLQAAEDPAQPFHADVHPDHSLSRHGADALPGRWRVRAPVSWQMDLPSR